MSNVKFAIIETGSNQYRVEEGQSLKVEKLDVEEGDSVEFEKVLLVSSGESVEVGQPYVSNTNVVGEVLEQGRDDKKIVFRYKPKKRQRRKQGHRQPYTKVKITNID